MHKRSHSLHLTAVFSTLLMAVSVSSAQSISSASPEKLTFGSGRLSGLTVNTIAESPSGAMTIRVDLPVSDATGTIAVVRNYHVVGTGTVANGFATINVPAPSEKEITVYPGKPVDAAMITIYSGDQNYNTVAVANTKADPAVAKPESYVSKELTYLQADEKVYGRTTLVRTKVLLSHMTRGVVLFFNGNSFIGSSTVLGGSAEIVRAQAATTAICVEVMDVSTGEGR